MSDHLPTLRAVDWRSVTPWGVLFRVPMLAAAISVMLLATAGVVLSAIWWQVGGWALSLGGDDWRQGDVAAVASTHDTPVGLSVEGGVDGVQPVAWYYLQPARALVSTPRNASLPRFAYLVWGCLGSLLIWGCLGGAITRIAVMRLGRDEHVGIVRAVRFAVKRLPALVSSALYPLALLIPLAIVGAIVGLVLRLDWGASLVGLVWFIGLLVTMVCAVVVFGVWVGWPLMVATVSAEGTDSLDGLSRGFAYAFQRPVHYVFYLLVGGVLSFFAVAVMSLLLGLVGDLAWWSVSWGAGSERVYELRQAETTFDLSRFIDPTDVPRPSDPNEQEARGGQFALESAQSMFRFWDQTLATVLNGFRFGLFWCLVAGVYLLLRQQVDETEFDEVYLEPVETKPLPDLEAAQETEEAPTQPPEPSATGSASSEPPASDPPADSGQATAASESAASDGSGSNEPPRDPEEPDDVIRDE